VKGVGSRQYVELEGKTDEISRNGLQIAQSGNELSEGMIGSTIRRDYKFRADGNTFLKHYQNPTENKKARQRAFTSGRLRRVIDAEGGTRTPTGCPTRPSNVRVYQFHHFGRPGSFYTGKTAPKSNSNHARHFFSQGFFSSGLGGSGVAGLVSLLFGVAALLGGVVCGSGTDSIGFDGVSGVCTAGPTPSPTERRAKSPGIENRKAVRKKRIAAPMVIFASTVWVPRGPKADEFAPPPPNTAAASDLPGCNNTKSISTTQERM
jgi:hypothetical protein